VSDYPEHDKLSAVKDASQAIGEFIEFSGYTLCQWREAGDNGEPQYRWTDAALQRRPERGERRPRAGDYFSGLAVDNPAHDSWGSGWEAVGRPVTQILADYFEVDLAKIECEKRAMLDSLRALHAR
jgi:hypothetical protein